MFDLNAFRVFDGGEVEFFIPRAQFVGVGLERGQLRWDEFELQQVSRAEGEEVHHGKRLYRLGEDLTGLACEVWMRYCEYNPV